MILILDFTFKIVLDADFLKRVNEKTKLVNGSIVLEDLFSNEPYFTRDKDIWRRNLAENEAEEHTGWIKLLRGDTKLLKDYKNAVWRKSDKQDNMGIFLAYPEEVLSGCALHLSKIENHSDIGGDYYLDFERGSLVGKLR